MGLLDDLLGQIGGGSLQAGLGREQPRSAGGASAGGAMGPLLAALLPVVLSMLASRGGRTADQVAAGASASGGLGDILSQVLGGRGGGAGGGLGALLEQFQRAGFGEQAGSWVGPGANQPLTPDALEKVFGRDGLSEIARRAGVSERDAERGLTQLLPEVVDRVTPEGRVPESDKLAASVDALTRRLGLG